MAPLPRPTPSTVRAIYKAYEDANTPRDGRSISVSTLAEECERKLFYDFRWVSPHESIPGRTLRLFATGHIEEERWIEDLRAIGCEVVSHDGTDRDGNPKQIMVEACGGHVRGYLDSEILGLPEAPKTIHVGEMKSHNLKSFTALKKDGVRKSKPLHFCQLQTYMFQRGRDRGIYLAVCKDNDELYAERMELDSVYVMRMLARAQRIIDSNEPPAKLHENPDHKMAFACGWCKHKPVCHEKAWPRTNCRTCLYSTPEDGGSWSCGRFSKPLSNEEQAAGCPAHLTLPGLIPGEQIDCDEEAETVTYRLWNGDVWTDGANNEEVTAMTTRPHAFDAALLRYMPALKSLAIAITRPGEREDLIQDTISFVLGSWQNFRGDPSEKDSGFYKWITINMRSIAQGKRRRSYSKAKHVDIATIRGMPVQPNQEHYAHLSQTLRTLDGMDSDTRKSVVACANGERLHEIAARHGVTNQAVSMRVQRARLDLADGFARVRRPYPVGVVVCGSEAAA